MRYYPLEPLAAATGLSVAALGRAVGLSGTTLKLARERGLREDAADRYAIRAGLHPLEVWPDWACGDVECSSSDCTQRFVPRDGKGQQRYCSATCRNRERARRYRATEAGAEAARRARRAQYADPRQREYEAALRTRPSARRAAAARRRYLRARARDAA